MNHFSVSNTAVKHQAIESSMIFISNTDFKSGSFTHRFSNNFTKDQ